MLKSRQIESIQYLKHKRHSGDVIEIDNYVILETLQNSHFWEYSFFVNQFGLKTCRI